MQLLIRNSTTEDATVRATYTDLFNNNKLVSALQSAKQCIRILVADSYVSGSHIDYYDQIEGINVNPSGKTNCCACLYCTCGDNCQCKAQQKPQCDACVVEICLNKFNK